MLAQVASQEFKESQEQVTYLTAGLDPDKGVDKRMASVSSRTGTKAGVLDVAPVTPRLLAGGLLTRAADINDEARREAFSLEQGGKSVDEALLVARLAALGDGCACGGAEGVVVGYVGDDTADTPGRASRLVDFSIKFCGRADVGIPAEPSGVSAIKVHVNVGEVERLEGVHGQVLVVRGGARALLDAHVCDQVGERVGLDGEVDLDIWVLLDGCGNLVNVLDFVLVHSVFVNLELAVGGQSRAVTVGKIVHDECAHEVCATGILGLDVRKVRL